MIIICPKRKVYIQNLTYDTQRTLLFGAAPKPQTTCHLHTPLFKSSFGGLVVGRVDEVAVAYQTELSYFWLWLIGQGQGLNWRQFNRNVPFLIVTIKPILIFIQDVGSPMAEQWNSVMGPELILNGVVITLLHVFLMTCKSASNSENC